MRSDALLPSGVQVLERGWLSSNNIVLTGGDYKEFPPTEAGLSRMIGELIEDHTIG